MACLAALVRYHGAAIGLDRLWALSEAGVEGTTLQQLRETAEAVGLEAGGYEADIEALRDLQAPCVLHVTTEGGRQHYVVCFGTQDGRFVVGDPASGVEAVPPALLAQRWQSRVLLTAEPAADFEQKVAEARAPDAPETGAVEREVRCFGVGSTPFGLNQLLVETAPSDGPELVPSGIGQLLLSLDHFDTLEHHAATCARMVARQEGGGEPRADEADPPPVSDDRLDGMKRQLRRYAQTDVLTTKSEVRSRIDSWTGGPADPPPSIAALGIPTAGRPESLRRALGSYLEDARGRAVPTRVVVMDDSTEPAAREETRAVVAEHNETYGEARLFYADRDRRRAYARTLADHAGVPPETVRFALLGAREHDDTYGAPRNALLLQTVGELSVQVDDDTVADTAGPPTTGEGLSLTSAQMPREWWFFDDRQALRSAVSPSDARVLDVHETLLGKTVAQCVSERGDEEGALHVGDVDADFFGQMQGDARVAVSFAGAMGDAGRLSTRLRLLADASTHERLVEDYAAHLDTTEVLRAPVRPTITNGAGCVSMNVGIDNRGLIPPFMPVGQGEDQVFGLALKLCADRTCRGYLPHALLHDPPGGRTRETGAPQFDGYGAYGLVQHLMAGARAELGADEEAALQTLGRHLETLGALSPAAFADYAERRAREALGQDVRAAERLLLDRTAAPTAWRDDVRRYLQSATTAAREGTLAVPTDLSGPEEERRGILRARARRYGTLLRHWPALRAAAADLKASGVRIAEAV